LRTSLYRSISSLNEELQQFRGFHSRHFYNKSFLGFYRPVLSYCTCFHRHQYYPGYQPKSYQWLHRAVFSWARRFYGHWCIYVRVYILLFCPVFHWYLWRGKFWYIDGLHYNAYNRGSIGGDSWIDCWDSLIEIKR